MRRFILLAYVVLLALLALPQRLVGAESPSPPQPGIIYVQGDQLMLDGQPFVMKGFNYYPRDYGWTSMADWDWDAVDRELALAAAYGANTIRTGLNFQYATGNVNARRNIYTTYHVLPEYLQAVDRLLEIADRHNLKVILWLNDGLYWDLWLPRYFPIVRKHLEEIIPRYANDPRLAAWDLGTDIDGSMLLEPPGGARGAIPWANMETFLTYFGNIADTVRALDPNHARCIGHIWMTSSLLTQEFSDFLCPQFLGGDHPEMLSEDLPGKGEEYISWSVVLSDKPMAMKQIENKVRWFQEQLERPMPLVLSEFGIYTAPPASPELQQRIYQTVLEVALTRMHLAGALNWSLTDFVMPPKAFTILPLDAAPFSDAEKTFGAFDQDYQPKPAAETARQFFTGQAQLRLGGVPDVIRFQFNQTFIPALVEPGSEDDRELAMAFDWIEFRSATDKLLLRLDIGDPAARPYLSAGFMTDEGPYQAGEPNFAWAGSASKQADLILELPKEARRLLFRATTPLENFKVFILLNSQALVEKEIRAGVWGVYSLEIPEAPPPQRQQTQILSGGLEPPLSGGTVWLETSYDDGATWQAGEPQPLQLGRFDLPLSFVHGGQALVRAAWSGLPPFPPVVSEALVYDVPRQETALSLPLPALEPRAGETVELRGSIEPAIPGATLQLAVRRPDGSQEQIELQADSAGRFSYPLHVAAPGDWSLQAEFPGDQDYLGSSASLEFSVQQPKSRLACRLEPQQAPVGESVLFSASLEPPLSGAELELEVTPPQGAPLRIQLISSLQGQVEHRFSPDAPGVWQFALRAASDLPLEEPGCAPLSFQALSKPPYALYAVLAALLLLALGASLFWLQRRRAARRRGA